MGIHEHRNTFSYNDATKLSLTSHYTVNGILKESNRGILRIKVAELQPVTITTHCNM